MRDISTKENTNGDQHERYRLIYSLVAYAFLPIFEAEPKGWNAIRALPNSDSCIKKYLDEWSELVEKPYREFVRLCKIRYIMLQWNCIQKKRYPYIKNT